MKEKILYLDELFEKFGIKDYRVVTDGPVYLSDCCYWWTNMLGEWSGAHFEIIDGEGYHLVESEVEFEEGQAANGEKWKCPVYELYVASDGWVIVEVITIDQGNEERERILYVGERVKLVKEDTEYWEYRKRRKNLSRTIHEAIEQGNEALEKKALLARIKLDIDYIRRNGISILDFSGTDNPLVYTVLFGNKRGRYLFTKTIWFYDNAPVFSDEETFQRAAIARLYQQYIEDLLECGEPEDSGYIAWLQEQIAKIAEEISQKNGKNLLEWIRG